MPKIKMTTLIPSISLLFVGNAVSGEITEQYFEGSILHVTYYDRETSRPTVECTVFDARGKAVYGETGILRGYVAKVSFEIGERHREQKITVKCD